MMSLNEASPDVTEPAATTPILLVEDETDDAFLIEHAFATAAPEVRMHVCKDGEAAAAYLAGLPPYQDRTRHPLPYLVILDLKLPRMNGVELLQWIRRQEPYKDLPVVVHSSSRQRADIDRAYYLGANAYVPKEVDLGRLVDLARGLVVYAALAESAAKGA
jgi:CheY-like chemotaxis protein